VCLGIPTNKIIPTSFTGDSVFWCVNESFDSLHPIGNTLRLFPVYHIEDYTMVTQPFVSHETKSLMYTLGVLYAILLVGFVSMPV
jgi:hypothetical protein